MGRQSRAPRGVPPHGRRRDHGPLIAARSLRRPLLFGAAAIVWVWTTLGHAYGTELARDYFAWAQTPGHLHADGGSAGMHVAELTLAAGFLAIVAGVLGTAAWRLRRSAPAERRERLFAWALWGCFVYLLWTTVIVYTTEFVHFAQYGVVAALLCAAIHRGRRPELAFLIAVGLGALDEAWQHWGIELWLAGNLRHGFDWSDVILNAAGACSGALMFTTGAREPDASERGRRVVVRAVAVLAALLLLLLEQTTLAGLFGTYMYHPFWSELENGKPVHWMTPIDGIPLAVASVLLLGLLLTTGRALVTRSTALAVLALIALSIQPPSRLRGMPVHELVPTAVVHRVPGGSVVVDGILDKQVWQDAQRIGPFAHSGTRKA